VVDRQGQFYRRAADDLTVPYDGRLMAAPTARMAACLESTAERIKDVAKGFTMSQERSDRNQPWGLERVTPRFSLQGARKEAGEIAEARAAFASRGR
jgi:hypothetical protein